MRSSQSKIGLPVLSFGLGLCLKFLYQTAFDQVDICPYFLSRLCGRNRDVVENQNFCKTKHFERNFTLKETLKGV